MWILFPKGIGRSWIPKNPQHVSLASRCRMICHRRNPYESSSVLRVLKKSESNWTSSQEKEWKQDITCGPSVGQTSFLMHALCDVFHSQKRIVVDWLNHPFWIFSFLFLTGGHCHPWNCGFHSGAWWYINFEFGHVFSQGKLYLAGCTIRWILERAYVRPKAVNVKLETSIGKRKQDFCSSIST